ncbi:hypothetical protein [Lignipirellula cremea]|uniref:Tetratricopeptide repeat protein n=1 Tax=Lignipirellula cremea TaxID=2528010 RepID=A0A518DRD5_9BACT|nr:hypothetical protein [Lignipirellula cremea]QDU94401.1 hypothetical protein Pla8534_21910 [Lignipirellula cremea]
MATFAFRTLLRPLCWAAFAVAVGLIPLGTVSAASPSALELAAFLEADSVDAVLSAGAETDPRAEYVIALAAMKARKYDEALARLDAATTRERTNLAAWRAKFWLLTYRKNRDHAIAQMKQLTLLFPERAANSEIDRELQLSALWMGRLCEYMASPGEHPPAGEAAAQIEARLQGDYLTQFQQGRREVIEEHEKYLAEIEASRADDETAATERAENDANFVANERDRVATERDQIETSLSDAQKTATDAAAAIDKGFAPLQQQLQQLRLAVGPIQARINSLQLQHNDVIAQAARIQDPVLKESLLGQTDAIIIQLRRERDFLRPYEFEAARLNAEYQRLMQQKAIVGAQFQGQVNQANSRQESLNRTEKNLNRQENKPVRTTIPSSTRTRGMQAKAESLTSYQAFPLEEERLRMIQLLRQ